MWWRRGSLVDMIARAIEQDPGDAPVVYLEADIMADEMERYAPAAEELDPAPRPRPQLVRED